MKNAQKCCRLDDLPEFCTVEELPGVLGVSRATAYRMADRGMIPCIRLGRRIILSKEHLKTWIDREIRTGRNEQVWQDV